MNNTRDNSPELDYFELRKRHEEYKNRTRAKQSLEKAAAEKLERKQAQRAAQQEEEILHPADAPVAPEFKDSVEEADPLDAFDEAIEEGYEDFDDADADEYDDSEGEADENPNPFAPFIRGFNGMKSKMAGGLFSRRAKHAEDDEDEFEGFDDLQEDIEAAPEQPRRAAAQPEADDEAFEAADAAMDIEDDIPAPAFADEDDGFDDDFDDGFDDDGEDFDDADEDFDEEDDVPSKGGFKKFINLFVTRVDDDEIEGDDFDDEDEYDPADEDDDEDEVEISDSDVDDGFDVDEFGDSDEEESAEPVRKRIFALPSKKNKRHSKSHRAAEDDEFSAEFIRSIHSSPEGGLKMEEMNKPANEAAQQPAAQNSEPAGMTRRERRELAMRLAAEEAARKAAEEAARKAAEEAARAEEEKAAAETAIAVEPLFSDEPEKVDMAAFEDAPEVDVLVETTAADAAAEDADVVDEPTREFKPVSMRDVQEASDKGLFDTDEDEDDEDYDDEDDDEDDEDEIVEKKPRRGLFGRRRAKDEDEDEEDDEDEDDYDDEDDDEDDEDEIVEKKPRRGLFGRKRAKDEDEDEEDDEDEDDYDDEDEGDEADDEYDEYDDEDEDEDDYDDEDEYDDDDDEPRRSFGHHLIGIFKVVLAIILVLLIAIIGLNFHHYIAGENVVITKLHDVLGDSGAADVLCFSYNMRKAIPAPEVLAETELEPEISLDPTAIPQPESTTAIPDLDTNGTITETPVVQAAPVVIQNGSIG